MNVHGNFYEMTELAPPPAETGTRTVLPPVEEKSATEQAGKTLVAFHSLLYDKRYAEAVRIFAGGYGIVIIWNYDLDPRESPALLQRGCEWNGFVCSLRVGRIIEARQISPMEYRLTAEFIRDDGTLYRRFTQPDAGAPTVSRFLRHAAQDCSGEYLEVDWPFYGQ